MHYIHVFSNAVIDADATLMNVRATGHHIRSLVMEMVGT